MAIVPEQVTFTDEALDVAHEKVLEPPDVIIVGENEREVIAAAA